MSFKALFRLTPVVASIAILGAVTQAAWAQPAANTWYRVVNKTSAKCVDAAGGGTGNGTAVQQWACNTNLQQQWLFTATSGGYYQVGTRNASGQTWDVQNVSTSDGAKIQLWAYGGGNNQQWQPAAETGGYYHFVNRNSGKCLDDTNGSTSDGTQLQQWACSGGSNQAFSLVVAAGATATATAAATATATTTTRATATSTSRGTPTATARTTATPTATTRATATATTRPTPTPSPAPTSGTISAGLYYNLVNSNSGKCVQTAAGGTANGTAVQQGACVANTDGQLWQFTATDSGYYVVAPRSAAGQGWDVTGGTGATGDAVPIQLWAFVAPGGTNQQWQPVAGAGGRYTFVARHSGKCLNVPGASTGDGVQLQQQTCDGSAAESFTARFVPTPTPSPSPTPVADANFRVSQWWSSEKNPKDGAWYTAPMPITYRLFAAPILALTQPGGTATGTTINVDAATRYQTMQGIGASLEESTVYNLSRMSPAIRQQVLRGLVDPVNGIGMNLMRLPFGTSDFTGRPWYSYDDTCCSLSTFSIQKDIDYNIIAVVKEALSYNPNLKFFASPWSPPGWMKSTGTMTGGNLLTQNYAVAAQYYRMAVQAYQAQGIPIYAFTVQNEPGVSAGYPSCSYTWQQERDFVKAVKAEFQNNGLSTKVWILDHNFDMATNYAGQILADAAAYAATDGTAFHDYSGDPSAMTALHNSFPNKEIFFTERSVWGTAGMDRIAQYVRNWASTYSAWVTMLDQNRKPNNGPFTADPTIAVQSATNFDTYWWIPEYYLTGQYSKFVQFGARRIASDYGSTGTVTTVGFLNPDNTIVLVVINQTGVEQPVKIAVGGNQIAGRVPAASVATYQWKNGVGASPYPAQ